MSQRRGGSKTVKEEMVPFSEALDIAKTPMDMDRETGSLETTMSAPTSANAPGLGLPSGSDAPLNAKLDVKSQYQQQRIKQWKEGPFAAGFTEPSWEADYNKLRNDFWGEFGKAMNDDNMPCGCCSAVVCTAFGAGRVGNMAVLRERQERVDDGETKRRLVIVAGPYWPMLMLVTYPLILGVSTVTLVTTIPKTHPLIAVAWTVCTVGLILALALTAFRDPGILPRYESPPPGSDGQWRWNDRAHTYRPKGAWYDPDTAVVVEEFDHTCVSLFGIRAVFLLLCFLSDSNSHH